MRGGGVHARPRVLISLQTLDAISMRDRFSAARSVVAGAARDRRARAQTYDEKLATCLACHGEKGISETSEVPSLAGQPADFTLIQLFLFRQGTRKIEIMNDSQRT